MADKPNDVKEQSSPAQTAATETPATRGARGGIKPWLVAAMTVLVCAGAGFGVGRVFGTRGKAQTASAAGSTAPAEKSHAKPKPGAEGAEPWFYDIEPIVANLNEPGVTRYVRIALTLEVGNGMEPVAGKELLDQKKPLLKHWLTLYLSNQTLEGIRGEKNLRQVQTQVADALNQGLFPNEKPRIVGVLFKELSIQ